MSGWERVNGIVVRGYRIASGKARNDRLGSIELQMPLFRQLGLDISHCFPGTLNVSIAPRSWRMLLPKPTFLAVKWEDSREPENFYFSRCIVEFHGKAYAGWVYYPDPETKLSHFHEDSTLEIIAETIPEIQYDDEVLLGINSKEVRIVESG